MRYFSMIYGYARVSTVSQELEVQLQALESEGATVIYKEKFTGTKTDRPQLNELLSKLNEGDKLVVTRLDRLARNTKEGIEIIERLFAKGVNLLKSFRHRKRFASLLQGCKTLFCFKKGATIMKNKLKTTPNQAV